MKPEEAKVRLRGQKQRFKDEIIDELVKQGEGWLLAQAHTALSIYLGLAVARALLTWSIEAVAARLSQGCGEAGHG